MKQTTDNQTADSSSEAFNHVAPPYVLTPPIPQLPDFWLVEAQHNGKQHTLAMFPVFELPKGVVVANAKLFVDAPRMKAQLQSIHANALEALGSTIETRCYLMKALGLLKEGPTPDWTAVEEALDAAMRESETALVRVESLYRSQQEWRKKDNQ